MQPKQLMSSESTSKIEKKLKPFHLTARMTACRARSIYGPMKRCIWAAQSQLQIPTSETLRIS